MTTTHRMSTAALLALALGASAGPASAMPNQLGPGSSQDPHMPYGAHAVLPAAASTRAQVQAARATAPVSAPVTIAHVTAPNGFDWGDAGIGAAGGLALALVGLGGALAVSQRHGHDTAGRRHTAA